MFDRYHQWIDSLIFEINLNCFCCKHKEPREILRKAREINSLLFEWEGRVLTEEKLKDIKENNNE